MSAERHFPTVDYDKAERDADLGVSTMYGAVSRQRGYFERQTTSENRGNIPSAELPELSEQQAKDALERARLAKAELRARALALAASREDWSEYNRLRALYRSRDEAQKEILRRKGVGDNT